MPDRYKIIMSISHHRISFEYYLKGGDDALNPIPPGNWPAPLAFYCSPTGIVIGKDAEGAARARTPNAYTDYFGLLKAGLTYNLGGESKPLSKLLLDASETVFRSFYTEVMLTGSGTLEDNRLNMPLTVVCEADLKDTERAYIYNLFKDGGYDRISVVKYEKYIDRYITATLSKQYTCEKVLVAWTEGRDLVLSLFDARGLSTPTSKIYPNLGIDPRLNYVIERILEQVLGYNQWLERDDVLPVVKKAAMDFLNSNVQVKRDTINLPDGSRYNYEINRNSIDFLQCKETEELKKAIEEFLKENAVADRGNVLLLLRGTAAGNSYFERNMRSGFFGVVKSDKELRSRTMRLIIDDKPPIIAEPFTVEPIVTEPLIVEQFTAEPFTVGPTDSPTQNETTDGKTDQGSNGQNDQPQTAPPTPKPTATDNRRFRELRSSVITYIDNKRYAEARKAADEFLSEMHAKGVHDFDKDLETILSRIPKDQTPPEVQKPSVRPTPRERQDFRATKVTASQLSKNGKNNEAVAELVDFKGLMNSKGITEFDTELDSLIKQYQSKNTESDGPVSTKADATDSREFRIAKVTAKTHKMNGRIKEAVACLQEFKSKMNAKGVTEFDTELDSLIEEYNGAGKTKPEPKTAVRRPAAAGAAAPVKEAKCTPQDEREFRELQKMVQSKLDFGNVLAAKAIVNKFKTKMHAKGVHYFDRDIKALEDKIINSRK